MNLVEKVLRSQEFNKREKQIIVSKLNEGEEVNKITRVPVESSNLASVGYSGVDEVLEVEFQGGSVYRYSEVPVEVYEELMNADSHGSYFHYNVKEAGYDYYKVK